MIFFLNNGREDKYYLLSNVCTMSCGKSPLGLFFCAAKYFIKELAKKVEETN